ncbi:YbhB/YbcL family Raf kinase inhibitor-like protein [Nocardia abscessus]|uniref:YbhB/YbcL family Raf kinase inhibitor-like protein n=1 Tax=Nocardia abscessus TaxID=120957 RepID=UPI001D15B449|nr:YbhB/YbcL family Raf kinase inhibitor-like protein [Nocardia abscessus]MCC3328514.1 YbhB/YbcL family Raf kinase inhibitor-like protein [Nocardia abscessus]
MRSSAFNDGDPIPVVYTCNGRNEPPPLTWTAPPQAAHLALIVDDPDAPSGLFTHWVVSNIPPTTTSTDQGQTPAGGLVSLNSANRAEYFGPCPPAGTGVHHYRFIVYALSRPVQVDTDTPPDEARSAIVDASLGDGQLVGTYTTDR